MKQWLEGTLRVEEWTADTTVAVVTWAVLLAVSLDAAFDAGGSAATALLAAGLFLVYLVALLAVAVRQSPSPQRARVCLGVELGAAIGLFVLMPLDYLAILLVIWSAQASWFVDLRRAIALALAVSLAFLFARPLAWGEAFELSSWALFSMFNVFAAVMMTLVRREQVARLKLERSNRQLETARDMLSEAARQAETMRLDALREAPVLAEPLTDKEREILRLAASGCSNRMIAELLHNSEGTIKNHFSNILGKLGVRDRTAAVVRALGSGLLDEGR
ncbi:response regulator transcription factor [Wenzhouxiangella sediminis]|nr:response regulator transcription factor [Wenzhouxiangella sediminis]